MTLAPPSEKRATVIGLAARTGQETALDSANGRVMDTLFEPPPDEAGEASASGKRRSPSTRGLKGSDLR